MGKGWVRMKQGSLTVVAPASATKTAAAAANAAAANAAAASCCTGWPLCWSPGTHSSLARSLQVRHLQLFKATAIQMCCGVQQLKWDPLFQ